MFDGTDVYEHIFAAALRLNEPIALRWIEPFHGAGSHAGLLAESNNNSVVRSVGNSKLPPWLAAKGNGSRSTSFHRQSDKKRRCRLHGGASGSGGPPSERNGQYPHLEATKARIAARN